MTEAIRLWGWLGQDHDPLAGKAKAEDYLRRMLDLKALADVPASAFHAEHIRASRLPAPALEAVNGRYGPECFSTAPAQRAAASVGQSLPDQIARRRGAIPDPVDGVVFAKSSDDLSNLFSLAAIHRFTITPVGGATNVTGGFSPDDSRPRVAVSLRGMNRVLDINETDMCVEAEAGILLADLEAALNNKGLTLGHFPQSFHGVTLGGAIAANGSGQRSLGYGRISDMLISAQISTPLGLWSTEPLRHAATGPWLGGLVCGSEGLFGIIVSAHMRLRPLPQTVTDWAWILPDFASGLNAVRNLTQHRTSLSMLRLSDEVETGFLSGFRLAMKGRDEPPLAERLALRMKKAPRNPALLIAGFEGHLSAMSQTLSETRSILQKHGGVFLGAGPGASWRKGRYDLPYLRESLLRRGISVDTFETVAPWSRLADLKSAAVDAFDRATDGKGRLMCHLSHSYVDSACLYFTGLWPQRNGELDQWHSIKAAMISAFVARGGAASHHHGVGAEHADAVAGMLGVPGFEILRGLKRTLDPENLLQSGISTLVT